MTAAAQLPDLPLARVVQAVLAGQSAAAVPAADPSTSSALRGDIDARAVRQRFSDAALHNRLAPAQPVAHRLHDACEQLRCEALGVRRWPGMALNLAALPVGRETGHDLPAAARQWLGYLRQHLGLPAGGVVVGALHRGELAPAWRLLVELLVDQRGFALACQALLRDSGVLEDPDQPPAPVALMPPPAPVMARPAPAPAPAPALAVPKPSAGEARRLRAQRRETVDVLHRLATQPRGRPVVPSVAAADGVRYAVYTRRHDVLQRSQQVCSAAQLATLAQRLARLDAQGVGRRGPATQRLQRQLMARRPQRWQADADSGTLDPARLAAIVADPLRPPRLRRRHEDEAADTQVTLLIDTSGSLRGKPIELAAACAQSLVATLERCGVRSEVLGFTTVGWRGGEPALQWRAAGSPPAPGRLAALRHVVYKAAGESAARARRQLAALLHDELLRENIDGEAVHWALQRLSRSNARRRILLVLCDGLPQDAATLAANGPHYLLSHLQHVLGQAARFGVEPVVALGLCREVTQGYGRALVIDDLAQLPQALPERLAAALAGRRRTA